MLVRIDASIINTDRIDTADLCTYCDGSDKDKKVLQVYFGERLLAFYDDGAMFLWNLLKSEVAYATYDKEKKSAD